MLLLSLLNTIPYRITSRFGNLPPLSCIQENDSPGSAVAKLFASVKMSSKEYGVLSHCLHNMPSEAQMRVCIAPCASQIMKLYFVPFTDFYFELGNGF